jgi:hypothetical protein
MLGGRITRSLNKIPDEYKGYPTEDGSPFGIGLDLHGFLTGVRLNSYSNAQVYDVNNGGAGRAVGENWVLGPTAQGYEGEPDLFRFSIMGLSGEFMIGNDGIVKVKSNDPDLKVDISGLITYGSTAFCIPPNSQIILTDGEGNRYYFGGDFSKFELSYSRNSPGNDKDTFTGYPYISSFSISKIILSNNREIHFNYKQGTLLDDFCHMMNRSTNLINNAVLLDLESYYYDGSKVSDIENCPNNPDLCNTVSAGSSSNSKSYSLLKKSLLETIVFEDYKIAVNYKDIGYPIKHDDNSNIYFNEFVLDYVSTYYKTELIKKTSFEYQNLGGYYSRPFLSKITELDPTKFYSFEYYDANNLPKYDTKGIDHWGYWNGMDSNPVLAPYDTYNATTGDYTLNNTFRDARITKTNVALLKKIIYPTKGYTVFEYEPQYYGKRIERNSGSAFLPTLTNNSGLCGGARIKRQYDFSGSGIIENEKEYKYTTDINNTSSSGILTNWPRYIYYFEFRNGGSYIEKYFIKSSSNVQQNSLDNYNVGYSKVFEIIKNKGYIEHNFTSHETFPDQLSPDTQNLRQYMTSYPSYPENLYKNFKNLYGNDKSVLRGRPLVEKIYANNGSLLKKTEYTYHDMINYNSNTSQDESNYVAIQHLSGVWVQGYKKYFNNFSTKSKSVTNYFNNGQVTSLSEYFYESTNHLKTSREKTTTTIGDVLETKYYYPQDTQMASKPFVTNLKNSNISGKPLVTQTYNNGIKLSESETVYGQDTSTNNLLLPKEILSNGFPNPSNGLERKYTYNKYDSKGNITQYTQENGIPVTIIWGYKQTLPIAKIENATYAQVQSYEVNLQTLSEGTDENALIQALNALRSNLPNAMITTYTHKPLVGVSTITDPKGDIMYYFYDSFGRLLNIKDKDMKILSENKYHYKN